jgi:hypothetical protein
MVLVFILQQDTSIFDAPAIVLCDMKKMEKKFCKGSRHQKNSGKTEGKVN